MAIALDGQSASATGFAASRTWAHTVTTDDNTWLLVTPRGGDDEVTVDNVTYGGITLTQLIREVSGAVDIFNEIWALEGVEPGTSDIVVTYSAGNVDAFAQASSYTGVTSYRGVTSTEGFTSSPSLNTATEADDWVVDVFCGSSMTTPVSPQTGLTVLDGAFGSLGHSYKEADTTSTGMSWTDTDGFMVLSAVVLVPAPDAPAPTTTRRVILSN
jgi:hypothetical protein